MTPAARAFAKKATAASKGGQYAYGYMPTQAPKVYDAAGDGALPGRPDMPDAPLPNPRLVHLLHHERARRVVLIKLERSHERAPRRGIAMIWLRLKRQTLSWEL